MLYKTNYYSSLGDIILLANEEALLGAWFVGQKYEGRGFDLDKVEDCDIDSLQVARSWLDAYFAGENPQPLRMLSPQGTTFQKKVWQVLTQVPVGHTLTYGQIAEQIGCKSAQAVGGAVGKNPLSLFIPCHRVLGVDGSLTGYAGGLAKKAWLLKQEGATFKE